LNYQYVETKENASKNDTFKSNLTIEGMGLVKLKSQNIDGVKQELSDMFENFSEEMLD